MMEDARRTEISALIRRMFAGKHKCGLAGDNAIKDLWDENSELRTELTELRSSVLCVVHCQVCGSDTAGSNEMLINKELVRLRKENEVLRDCISESAPMAWINGTYNEHAIEWEKRAAKLVGVVR